MTQSLPGDDSWYLEYITPELVMASAVKKVIYDGRTQYQQVQVIDTVPFGRSLILDGKTQSSEADEWVYHEGLVHPIMTTHPNPRRVFIAGGGEGATAREVLKHPSVTEVTMVDLDREVVELCQKHLPNHHQGAFDDPRMHLLHEDALAYLQRTQQRFDIVIIDIPDPLEGGPAYLLYTQEFYRLVSSRLNSSGQLVCQAGPAGPTNHTEVFTAIQHTISSTLDLVYPYHVYIPSFGSQWGFIAASNPTGSNLYNIPAGEIDNRLAYRLASPLRFYDGETHHGILSLPKYIREGFREETRVISEANPIFAT
jgi:spermidine synthase